MPLLLLRQAIGVLARQGSDEPGLAVVDVPGGAYRERHVATASTSTSASASVRQSSRSRSSRTIPTIAGSPSRSGSARVELERAGVALDLRQRARRRPSARPSARRCRRSGRRAARRGPHRFRRVVEHAQHQEARASRRGTRRACPRARRASACPRVAPAGADACACARSDRRGRLRGRLRPAQELVAGERDHVRARLDARAGGRLVERLHECPGPRSSTSGSPCRSASRARSRTLGCSVKPMMRKFD